MEQPGAILVDVYNQIDVMVKAKYAIKLTENMQYSTDGPLNNAIMTLERSIQKNQLFDQHYIIMHAIQQHMFPFAALFMAQFALPKELQSTDTEIAISIAIDHIIYLREKIKYLDTSVSEYKNELFKNVEFSRSKYSILGPFFFWKNREIKNEIKKLLRGEEIAIKADIKDGIIQNAVKFTEIGIELKISDTSTQSQLNTALDFFAVAMTLTSSCEYRCGSYTYSLPVDDKITIIYSFKKYPNGKPVMSNEVYQKLSESNAFLSPYTTWKIKIIKTSKGFDKLTPFENEDIGLELSGRGDYIAYDALPSEICSQQIF